jgi:pyroglutamyl-peptidase
MPTRPSHTVLLTGFEAFGGQRINPSQLVASALEGEIISGFLVKSATLPCAFADAFAELAEGLESLQPALVICVGQASGRSAINLERIAINLDHASMPDNRGARPENQPIRIEGPAAYWSSLPVPAIASALGEAGIAAALSQSAGSFVCNHVFYRLMETLAHRPAVRGGFIHIPLLPEQVREIPRQPPLPSMPLATMVEALRIAIRTSLL